MLRLADEITGSILIDGVDHASIPVATVRSAMALIPQDALMFSGSIRQNLDPLSRHSDSELLHALDQVELGSVVSKAGGLAGVVAEEGKDWSQGQRQLLCIARALLRRCNVVMLDEATASCDIETDEMVQRLIRKVFAECTVITVAHRIRTIMDSDYIMVLNAGRVVEYDRPEVLENRPGSAYRALVEETARQDGEAEDGGNADVGP